MKVTQTDMSHVNCTNNYTRIVYKVFSVNEYTPVFTSNSSSIELPEDIQIPFTNATVRFIFLVFLIVVNKKSFLVYILPGLCLISSISEEWSTYIAAYYLFQLCIESILSQLTIKMQTLDYVVRNLFTSRLDESVFKRPLSIFHSLKSPGISGWSSGKNPELHPEIFIK